MHRNNWADKKPQTIQCCDYMPFHALPLLMYSVHTCTAYVRIVSSCRPSAGYIQYMYYNYNSQPCIEFACSKTNIFLIKRKMSYIAYWRKSSFLFSKYEKALLSICSQVLYSTCTCKTWPSLITCTCTVYDKIGNTYWYIYVHVHIMQNLSYFCCLCNIVNNCNLT